MKIIVLFIFLLAIWTVIIEPNILTVEKVFIKDENLSGLKIVFASDFHIKPYEKYRLKRIIKAINTQDPDIVLLGGDYVNGHKKTSSMPIKNISKELSKIKSKYGTYAVVGNHDGWQGKFEIIKALEDAGIQVLFNSNVCFNDFCVAGVDDLQTGHPNIDMALQGVQKPVILLTHNPDIIEEIPYSVNLTLAGHLHGGQVRFNSPIVVPSKYGKKFANGYTEYKGKKIFTSKGLGSSILPIRFNCPPGIVVIRF